VNYWREQLFAHRDTAHSQPLVACSACLLGEPVRYDGGHKLQTHFEHWLLPHLQLQALCPEVGIGLGVPRPTLKVLASDFGSRIVQVENESEDVTNAILDYADSYLRKLGRFWPLCAYVFKARSPSCDTDDGIFASRFKLWSPWLTLVDEEDLLSEQNCQDLLLQAYLCRDILWQAQAVDIERVKSHYSTLLQCEITSATPDRESLWLVVKALWEQQAVEARRELIDRYRAI
jgi:uncharacterized protein YbbK (DUF523 family)